MTDKIEPFVSMTVAIVFWSAVYLTFLTPMELGDIWWHLKTGEFIWQTGGLPQSDPFSIIKATHPFVLKAFWLAQVLLYFVQRFADFYGLIAFKATVFTASLYLVHRLLKNYGLRPPASYLLMVPMILIGTGVDEIRAQSFSFLFFALSVYLLETRRLRLDTDRPYRPIWLLPPVMLIWANMHAGYVSALGILLFYSAVELIRKRPVREKKSFFLLTLASIACSSINPNGLQAIRFTRWMLDTATSQTATQATATAPAKASNTIIIHEFLSISDFTRLTGESYLYYSLFVLIALGIIGFVAYALKKKQVDILHLVLFSGLAYSAVITFRATFFFAIMGTAILGRNLAVAFPKDLHLRFLRIPTAIAVLAIFAFVIMPRSIIKQPPILENLIPVKVSNFVKNEHLPVNLFHPYEWGGYLMWSLYPDYRVFTDGRNADFLPDQNAVVDGAPEWDEILSKYNINTAIYWPLMPYKGNVPPVVFALLKSNNWSPVYWDLKSVAFVRTPLAKKPISKNSIWELLQSLIMAGIAQSPQKADNYVSLGELYMQRGLPTMARESFEKALTLDPGNRDAKIRLGLR